MPSHSCHHHIPDTTTPIQHHGGVSCLPNIAPINICHLPQRRDGDRDEDVLDSFYSFCFRQFAVCVLNLQDKLMIACTRPYLHTRADTQTHSSYTAKHTYQRNTRPCAMQFCVVSLATWNPTEILYQWERWDLANYNTSHTNINVNCHIATKNNN